MSKRTKAEKIAREMEAKRVLAEALRHCFIALTLYEIGSDGAQDRGHKAQKMAAPLLNKYFPD